jgi:hypothetical protein
LLRLDLPKFDEGERLLEQAKTEGGACGHVYNDSVHAAICAVCTHYNKDALCGIVGNVDGMLAAEAVVVQLTTNELGQRDLSTHTQDTIMMDEKHVCREL